MAAANLLDISCGYEIDGISSLRMFGRILFYLFPNGRIIVLAMVDLAERGNGLLLAV